VSTSTHIYNSPEGSHIRGGCPPLPVIGKSVCVCVCAMAFFVHVLLLIGTPSSFICPRVLCKKQYKNGSNMTKKKIKTIYVAYFKKLRKNKSIFFVSVPSYFRKYYFHDPHTVPTSLLQLHENLFMHFHMVTRYHKKKVSSFWGKIISL